MCVLMSMCKENPEKDKFYKVALDYVQFSKTFVAAFKLTCVNKRLLEPIVLLSSYFNQLYRSSPSPLAQNKTENMVSMMKCY